MAAGLFGFTSDPSERWYRVGTNHDDYSAGLSDLAVHSPWLTGGAWSDLNEADGAGRDRNRGFSGGLDDQFSLSTTEGEIVPWGGDDVQG